MDTGEYRTVIRKFVMEGLMPAEIKIVGFHFWRLFVIVSDSEEWAAEFRCRHLSIYEVQLTKTARNHNAMSTNNAKKFVSLLTFKNFNRSRPQHII